MTEEQQNLAHEQTIQFGPDLAIDKQESSQDELILLHHCVRKLENELLTAKDQNIRLQADMANLLKRKDHEREQSLKFAHIDFLKEFIFVLDSVDGALMSLKHSNVSLEQMSDGLGMMGQQLRGLLDKFGLVMLDPQPGIAFDPATCEAMSMQPTTDLPHNTVVLVVQKGYAVHGRVLRAARVIVANNPA